MKTQHYILFTIAGLIMILSSCCNCSDPPPLLKDTKFKLAYKLVDGSWDTMSVILPKVAKFSVESTSNGTYALCYRYYQNKELVQDDIKAAVIDFKLLSDSLVLDTASKRVELIKKDTI